MTHAHDHSYKLLFSEPEIIIDLMRGFVREPWVDALDFSTLQPVACSYISDDLRHREDDVIWKVKDKQSWIYIYLLIEFQSTVDHYMAVRLMSYIGLLYQDLIKRKETLPDKRLPPVFPVVLYNGNRRWRAPTQLADLIVTLPGGLEHYQPALNYLILDEGAYDLNALDPLKNLVAAIFRLEHHTEPEAILEVISNLIEWLSAPEQLRIRRSFSIWVNRVLRAPIDHQPEPNDLGEIKAMLAQRIPQWIREGELRGEAQGEAKTLLKLLSLKFAPLPAWVEPKLEAADKAQLDDWVERILNADKLEDVFGGSDNNG